ncbi:MAG: DUF5011 domain-containing protein [Candidatus Peribacteria bacterium]|nr:DUF5011 domain-containing protein [Candidatus Peribacteria bacterium]
MISIVGTVDTSITGDYLITYRYSDSAGNTETATRTVKVLDPNADEDGDTFTNEEEINAGTDPLDDASHPNQPQPVLPPTNNQGG